MRYLPKSPAERQEMLAAIGAKSIDKLFESIPEKYRLRQALNLPGPLSETEVIQYFRDRGREFARVHEFFRCWRLSTFALRGHGHDFVAR